MAHLWTLRAAFAGQASDVAGVARACGSHQANAAERRLLERTAEILARVRALPPDDGAAVRAVLGTITEGMLFDLSHFPGQDAASLAALETLEDLDRYTYLVAGCVGEFWTALHVLHRPRLASWDGAEMRAAAVRFGKALQLTNVLRDVAGDLRNGRCYLPARDLVALGLVPHDLLDREQARRARPLLEHLLRLALDHYDVAWRYTLAVPRAEWRMRLACAWPLLIGLGTLGAIAAHPDPLTTEGRIKVPRATVRTILVRSSVTVWSNRALAAHAARLRARIPL